MLGADRYHTIHSLVTLRQATQPCRPDNVTRFEHRTFRHDIRGSQQNHITWLVQRINKIQANPSIGRRRPRTELRFRAPALRRTKTSIWAVAEYVKNPTETGILNEKNTKQNLATDILERPPSLLRGIHSRAELPRLAYQTKMIPRRNQQNACESPTHNPSKKARRANAPPFPFTRDSQSPDDSLDGMESSRSQTSAWQRPSAASGMAQ
jgi:hypothetical protein